MPSSVDMPRHVLVIGQRLAPIAEQALPDASLEVIEARDLGPTEALRAGLELILVDVEVADPAVIGELIGALGQRPAPPAVLLAGGHLPTVLVKALLRLPRSDVLEAPFSSVDLARAIGSMMTDAPVAAVAAPAASSPLRSHCWTIVGSVGGCGATTLAVELTTTLARQRSPQRRVALVDLNLSGGAACAYLGGSANMLLAQASDPERIDAAMLDAFCMKIPDGPDLLACPRDPRAYQTIAAEVVCKTLEIACQAYEFVVIDMPRHHQAWTLDVLAGSDEILVVSELTVPALLAARDLTAEIEEALEGKARPRIILNRLASRMFGPAPSLAEAEKALQRKAFGGVTSDWEAAAASANLGGAIAHHRPKSKIVRDVELLTARLLAAEDTPAAAGAAGRKVA